MSFSFKPFSFGLLMGLVTAPSLSMAEQPLMQGVTLSGLVEVNAWHLTDYDDVKTSDIDVATVELGIDAQIHKWVNGHLLFLYEEGATEEFTVDEAILTLGNPDFSPVYLAAGQMYTFGSYPTHMISDPLTLVIGESVETAVQLGVEMQGFHASVLAFNGDTQKNEDNVLENFGVTLGYGQSSGQLSYDLGIGYTSNLADTDTATDSMTNPLALNDYVGGAVAHAHLQFGPVSLIGEYLTALDSFAAQDLSFRTSGAEPQAWNVEAGYTADLAGRETTFALGYQASEEALGLGLPESKILALASVGIYNNTSLSLEWARSTDYELEDGGTGEDSDLITLQLAVEF